MNLNERNTQCIHQFVATQRINNVDRIPSSFSFTSTRWMDLLERDPPSILEAFRSFGQWRRNRPLPSPFRTSVRCTRRRKGVSRARPTLLPLGRASVPLLWYPSYDPGFRVSRAAPGGERPRLTQTQNRSPFVALLATPSTLPRRLVTLVDIPALLCLARGRKKWERDR